MSIYWVTNLAANWNSDSWSASEGGDVVSGLRPSGESFVYFLGDSQGTCSLTGTEIVSSLYLSKNTLTIESGSKLEPTSVYMRSFSIIDGEGSLSLPESGSVNRLAGSIECSLLEVTGGSNSLVGGVYSCDEVVFDEEFLSTDTTCTFDGNVVVSGSINSSGTIANYEFLGDLEITSSTGWTPGNGQVYFGGNGDQTITLNSAILDEVYVNKNFGSATFEDDISVSGDFLAQGSHSILNFASGTTQTVDGHLIISGPSANVENTEWDISENIYLYNMDGQAGTLTGPVTFNMGGSDGVIGPYSLSGVVASGVRGANAVDSGGNSGITFLTDYEIRGAGQTNVGRASVGIPRGYQSMDKHSIDDSSSLDNIKENYYHNWYYDDFRKGKG